MTFRMLLCFVGVSLTASGHAQAQHPEAQGAPPDWRAMRIAAEKAVSNLLVLPQTAKFDWQAGFVEGVWRPYNSRPIPGWITCSAVYGKTRVGYRGGAVFVAIVRDGRVVFADMDLEPGGPINRGCNKMKLRPPQPGMIDSPVPSS